MTTLSPQTTVDSAQCEPLLVTVPEAARMLSLGHRKIWELVQSGDLPSVKVGTRSRRVPMTALRDFVRGLEERATCDGTEDDDSDAAA
jgi:excisionase family DNA binding protein